MPTLITEASPESGTRRMILSGELDLATAPELTEQCSPHLSLRLPWVDRPADLISLAV